MEVINQENNLEQKQDQMLGLDNQEDISQKQIGFLQGNLGKVINTGLDIGLRMILPNVIEDKVIDVKNAILNNGFKEGINMAINSAIDIGKSAIGIFTGKFENVSQVQTAIKKGGIIDSVSTTIDTVLKSTTKNGIIDKNVSKLIKKGKNAILDTVESNIEENFLGQMKAIEKIGKYTKNWEEYYQNQDIDGMNREYKKIKNQIDEVIPLESTIQKARQIANVQTLILENVPTLDIRAMLNQVNVGTRIKLTGFNSGFFNNKFVNSWYKILGVISLPSSFSILSPILFSVTASILIFG